MIATLTANVQPTPKDIGCPSQKYTFLYNKGYIYIVINVSVEEAQPIKPPLLPHNGKSYPFTTASGRALKRKRLHYTTAALYRISHAILPDSRTEPLGLEPHVLQGGVQAGHDRPGDVPAPGTLPGGHIDDLEADRRQLQGAPVRDHVHPSLGQHQAVPEGLRAHPGPGVHQEAAAQSESAEEVRHRAERELQLRLGLQRAVFERETSESRGAGWWGGVGFENCVK